MKTMIVFLNSDDIVEFCKCPFSMPWASWTNSHVLWSQMGHFFNCINVSFTYLSNIFNVFTCSCFSLSFLIQSEDSNLCSPGHQPASKTLRVLLPHKSVPDPHSSLGSLLGNVKEEYSSLPQLLLLTCPSARHVSPIVSVQLLSGQKKTGLTG